MASRPSEMSREAFVARYGGVFEHSPWIAEAVFDRGLGPAQDTAEGLHTAMVEVLRQADRDAKLALIKAHPDLAGRLAMGSQLSAHSSAEQAGAELDKCTPEEFRRFHELNEAYKALFGFPFVMAVKGRTRGEILRAFEHRVHNDPEAEFETALGQIERIALLRLRDLLPSDRAIDR